MRKNVLYALWLFILPACSHQQAGRPDRSYSVDINVIAPIEEFVSSYDGMLPLETNDESLISQVDKVVVQNDVVYVMDYSQRCIQMFDRSSGKWLGKIDKTGRGPGEYLYLDDFDVIDSKIYILSHASRKLNVYTSAGECVFTVDTPDRYSKLKVVSESMIWFCAQQSNNGNYNYVLFDPGTGMIVCQFGPFPENASYLDSAANPFCGGEGDVLYTANIFDNRVFSLSVTGYEPFFSIDMNLADAITLEELDSKNPYELYEAYRYKECLRQIKYVWSSEESLYLVTYGFFNELALRYSLVKVDLATGKSKFHRLNDEFDRDIPFLGQIVGVDDHTLISVSDAYTVCMNRDCYRLKGFDGIREDQNSILFFHTISM